jgi:protein-S-isoprenylcysteine O-methyltransferase Ste14
MGPYYPRLAFCPLATLTTGGPAVCMPAAVAPSFQVNAAVRTGGSAGRLIATALFVCVMVVWVALEAVQGLRRRRRSDPAAHRTDRGSLLLVIVCVGLAVLLARLAVARVPQAVVPGGIVTSTDQPAITTGPYRFVRHPSYLGLILILTGIGIILGNWLSIAALAIIPPIAFGYRIHVEERALSAALGDRYTSYAAQRKRLVPFVW